ncbi:MAG TPA: penicillin-binding protein [Syntrophales bacterium]|nr:penicillin-binding protein [Syntrophales bacterium]HOL59037.1 penicillin-binding protein [Syntrophales bacterium]HPO36289.1 penicillin-binding protein [Syntrophales bacterium]
MREGRKWLRLRIATVMIIFFVVFVALISRAFQLQILSGEVLKKIATQQHIKTLTIQPERGIISDRNGEKMAVSILADSVCADPMKVADKKMVAEKLAEILKVRPDGIRQKLSSTRNFCWIARKISSEQASKIEALNFEGVFLIKEPKRFYPNGELAAHVLGVVGIDSVGLEGLERQYDKYIRGEPEKLVWARDAKGKRLYPQRESDTQAAKRGASLVTTIDSKLQFLVETKLKSVVREKGAKGGYIIVMDPNTGEILAMANEPGFDPNNITKSDLPFIKNKVISDCYDPGSTFKPFLVSAAIEEKVVSEKDKVFCEYGNYAVADRIIREAQRKRYGYLTVREVLKYSSNIGSAKIAERLGKERFYNYIRKFGFGEKTGIDLPGEVSGLLRPYQRWSKVDLATIAFGQGISITGIQLITALSAIANGGKLMKPFLVKEVIDKNGQVVVENKPQVVRRVISQHTAKRIAEILTEVVSSDDGTGKKARIEKVDVAGKTGTAQKFDFSRHVYSSERVRTAFMGFFPAESPRVAMLVVLDEPKRDKWGGVASAPVFKAIGEQILTCFKTDINPDVFPQVEGKELVKLASAQVPSQSVPLLYEKPSASVVEDKMPDFRGLTIREALLLGKSRGIEVKVIGTGWATHQDPSPGMVLNGKKTCTVFFSMEQ